MLPMWLIKRCKLKYRKIGKQNYRTTNVWRAQTFVYNSVILTQFPWECERKLKNIFYFIIRATLQTEHALTWSNFDYVTLERKLCRTCTTNLNSTRTVRQTFYSKSTFFFSVTHTYGKSRRTVVIQDFCYIQTINDTNIHSEIRNSNQTNIVRSKSFRLKDIKRVLKWYNCFYFYLFFIITSYLNIFFRTMNFSILRKYFKFSLNDLYI